MLACAEPMGGHTEDCYLAMNMGSICAEKPDCDLVYMKYSNRQTCGGG